MIDVTAKSAGFILYSLLAQPKLSEFHDSFIYKFSADKILIFQNSPIRIYPLFKLLCNNNIKRSAYNKPTNNVQVHIL